MATRVRSLILLILAALLWMEAFRKLSSMDLLSAGTPGKSTISNPAFPGKSLNGWTGVPGLIKEENNRTIFCYKYGNKTGDCRHRVFHNSRLIRRIQQKEILKKFRDLSRN